MQNKRKMKIDMKNSRKFLGLALACATLLSFQSCNKRNESDRMYTALVTIESDAAGTRIQLNDSTVINPTNLKSNLYNGKAVRALTNFTVEDVSYLSKDKFDAKIVLIDTIRTKKPVVDLGEEMNIKEYGNDRLEVINDWVCIGEDGYLTLRIRTYRGDASKLHYINLMRVENEKDGENEYTYEIRHNASGDLYGYQTDGLVAFDLNELAPADHSPVILHLRWAGFTENKTANCKLTFRKL